MPDNNIKKSDNTTRETAVKKDGSLAVFARKPPHEPPKEKEKKKLRK